MKPLAIAFTFIFGLAAFEQVDAQKPTTKPKPPVNPAFQKVTDDPSLPRVLLIGDSISIGYTAATRKLLAGEANVHRIPGNGGPTIRGVASIEQWLGDGNWDVIHFNWGLHDLKYIDGKKQVSLEDYETNLTKLVQRMKKTGATLIWCSTTPVPNGNVKPPRKPEEVVEYNTVAARVMDAEKVITNDLFTFANKQLDKIQRPDNVHFTPEGSKVLATKVAAAIRAELKKPAKTP